MSSFRTGKKFLRLFAVLLMLLSLASAASADGGHDPYEKEAGGYKVNLVIEEPLKAGSSEIVIKLQTEQGEPVEGAKIDVEVEVEDDHAKEEQKKDDHGDEEKEKDDYSSDKKTEKADDHDEEESAVKEDDHAKAVSVAFEEGHEPGEYHGKLNFPKAGKWKITVHFEADHEENKVEYSVEVAPGASKAGVLAGFLGINVFAIAAAAVQKRRLAEAKKAALQARKDGAASIADVAASSNESNETGRSL